MFADPIFEEADRLAAEMGTECGPISLGRGKAEGNTNEAMCCVAEMKNGAKVKFYIPLKLVHIPIAEQLAMAKQPATA